MCVFNSKTKAGRKYLEWIWPLRSCQPHHLQVADWRRSMASERCPESRSRSYLHLCPSLLWACDSRRSSVCCAVIEPGSIQSIIGSTLGAAAVTLLITEYWQGRSKVSLWNWRGTAGTCVKVVKTGKHTHGEWGLKVMLLKKKERTKGAKEEN